MTGYQTWIHWQDGSVESPQELTTNWTEETDSVKRLGFAEIPEWSVGLHYVFDLGERRTDLKRSSNEFFSFEDDLLSQVFRDRRLFRSQVIEVDKNHQIAYATFENPATYKAEGHERKVGRIVPLSSSLDEQTHSVRVRLSNTVFLSGIVVVHLVLSNVREPEPDEHSSSLNEYELIMLEKLWQRGEGTDEGETDVSNQIEFSWEKPVPADAPRMTVHELFVDLLRHTKENQNDKRELAKIKELVNKLSPKGTNSGLPSRLKGGTVNVLVSAASDEKFASVRAEDCRTADQWLPSNLMTDDTHTEIAQDAESITADETAAESHPNATSTTPQEQEELPGNSQHPKETPFSASSGVVPHPKLFSKLHSIQQKAHSRGLGKQAVDDEEAIKLEGELWHQVRGLQGMLVGLLDYWDIGDDEVEDTFAKPVLLEDRTFVDFHKGTLFQFSDDDRFLETDAFERIGLSPYLLLPQSVLLHNEVLLEKAQAAADLTDKHDVSQAYRDAELNLRKILQREWLPNLFQYRTEQTLWDDGYESRGLKEWKGSLEERLKEIDGKLEEIVAVRERRVSLWIGALGLLFAIGQLGGSWQSFDAAMFDKPQPISVKLAVQVFWIVVLGLGGLVGWATIVLGRDAMKRWRYEKRNWVWNRLASSITPLRAANETADVRQSVTACQSGTGTDSTSNGETESSRIIASSKTSPEDDDGPIAEGSRVRWARVHDRRRRE